MASSHEADHSVQVDHVHVQGWVVVVVGAFVVVVVGATVVVVGALVVVVVVVEHTG